MLADRYELDHEIGRGGMGAVWLGRDTVLGRVVAIKQIGMTHGAVAPDLDRAEREAHLAARVNHHNVVAVFDLVDDDGHQWLVMEHVDGPTLAALIAEQGRIAPDDLAPILRQVAGALAAAHAHGIVHRDVKPSNILLTHDGTAKLSDFGVARAQADAALTQTGLVTGSPAYLSPEVATGRNATTASDVWSLGSTMFHALAGHPPYEVGDNVLGAMYRIVNEEPPRLAEGGRLADLVGRMMQIDPDARPTMAQIEEELDDTGVPPTVQVPAALAVDPEATRVTSPPTAAFAPVDDDGGPPTELTGPIDAPTPPVATQPVAPQPVTPQPVAPRPDRRAPRDDDHGRRNALIAAAAVAAVVIALVLAISQRGGDDPAPAAASKEPTSTGTAPSPDPTSQAPTDQAPTAAELEGFASDYLTAASNDPEQGFAMLTPDYQAESGGLKGYKGFWGKVKDVDVQSVQGDPDAMTVSYRYSYDFKGDRVTEDVTLRLVPSGDTFLVSGTA